MLYVILPLASLGLVSSEMLRMARVYSVGVSDCIGESGLNKPGHPSYDPILRFRVSEMQ